MKCCCCQSNEIFPTYADLFRCKKCNHVFANVNLSDAELNDLYSEKYFCGEEYGDYAKDRDIIEKNFNARINQILCLTKLEDKVVFEVGCAYGFFLNLIKKHAKQVSGIDISVDAVKHAKNNLLLNATTQDYLSPGFTTTPPDIICMWDTIEHLRNPDKFVEKSSSILSSGGFLFLTTGDIQSINARYKREKWRLIHPPTHLHYFSKTSINALLTANGFELIHFSHPGFYRSFGSTFINLTRGKKYNFIGNILGRIRASYYLNLYDIMFVCARKL
jgi:SAM-dependent methyltransferase